MPAVERLHQRPADRTGGVVDQDVDAAEAVLHRLHRFVDRVEIGEVARQRDRGAAVGGDPLGHRVEQVLSACDGDDGGALLRDKIAAASPMPNNAPLITTRLSVRFTV